MFCCETMEEHLDRVCADHGTDAWACPDATLVTTRSGVGIPVRDGGTSYIEISHCPWCGARL